MKYEGLTIFCLIIIIVIIAQPMTNQNNDNLEISNLTAEIINETNDKISEKNYNYHIHAVIEKGYDKNLYIHLNLMNSNKTILKNISTEGVIANFDSSNNHSHKDIDFEYYSVELVDVKYANLEIFNSTNLLYNETTEFKLT